MKPDCTSAVALLLYLRMLLSFCRMVNRSCQARPFAGALRSAVEGIVQSLAPPSEVECCVLFDEPETAGKTEGMEQPDRRCWAKHDDLRKKFEQASAPQQNRMLRDGTLKLCPICRFFGSVDGGKV